MCEQPHAKRTRHFQKRFSINVWGSLFGNAHNLNIHLTDR